MASFLQKLTQRIENLFNPCGEIIILLILSFNLKDVFPSFDHPF